MTALEFLSYVNDALRGLDDDAPTFGDDEANYWLRTLNRKKSELYRDIKQRWGNIYDVRSLGTVNANAAPSFELDDDFLAPSGDDSVTGETATGAYIINTDGTRYNLTLCHPEDRTPNIRQVFVAGQDPQVLYFTNEVLANETIINGELFLPGYWMPDDVVNESDTLPFLDPFWAVMAVASEIAFNDIIYEDKSPDLNNKANNLFTQMVSTNRKGTWGKSRKVPTSINRIRSSGRSR